LFVYYEPERQPSSYNEDNGVLLNNYYEELDKKENKNHDKKDNKDNKDNKDID